MITYLDKVFCASFTCQNKCGRILTDDIREQAQIAGLPLAMAFLCDENGEVIKDDDIQSE